MRIAIDAVGIRMGGGAVLLEQLLAGLPPCLPEAEWRVFVLPGEQRFWSEPGDCRQIHFEPVSHAGSLGGRLRWLHRRLPQKLAATGADVLLAFANLACVHPPVPQVVYCHQPNAFLEEGIRHASPLLRARLRALRWLILRGALASQRVIVQTAALENRMAAVAPRLQGRICVIPAPCRQGKAGGAPSLRVRQAIGELPRPRVLYVARPSIHKNHERLIAALPRLLQAHPQARLLLTIGKDENPHDRGYARTLQRVFAAARGSGAGDHIAWLGVLSPDDVAFALRHSDVMAFPSLSESFGLPLAEAMTLGCPLAAADLPYAREVAGPAAAYFSPWDPDSIAATLASVLGDGARRSRLGDEGLRRAQLFSSERVCRQIAGVLQAAAKARRD
jgi:glycosyltransferase involved in cell wall biosynthesis